MARRPASHPTGRRARRRPPERSWAGPILAAPCVYPPRSAWRRGGWWRSGSPFRSPAGGPRIPPPLVTADGGRRADRAVRGRAALARARRRGRASLQMWAYIATYQMPNDDPEALARAGARRLPGPHRPRDRARRAARRCGCSARSRRPGAIRRADQVLVWSHWIWFLVPHGDGRVPPAAPAATSSRAAAARMYAVFDLGVIGYWAIPTAPPWYAAEARASWATARPRCAA